MIKTTTKVNDDPRRNEKVSNDPNTHSHVMMIAFIQRYSPLSSRLTAHRLTSPLEHSQDLKRVLTNGIRRSPWGDDQRVPTLSGTDRTQKHSVMHSVIQRFLSTVPKDLTITVYSALPEQAFSCCYRGFFVCFFGCTSSLKQRQPFYTIFRVQVKSSWYLKNSKRPEKPICASSRPSWGFTQCCLRVWKSSNDGPIDGDPFRTPPLK